MYNNTQQPLFPTVGSGASSSNIRASAMDSIEPSAKRRRLTTKQGSERLFIEPGRENRPAPAAAAAPPAAAAAAAPPADLEPRVTVQESASVRSLFSVTVDRFPDGYVGLEPISLSDRPLQAILENRIGTGEPFKLKVQIEWEAKKLFGADGEVMRYHMTFTAFKVPPSTVVIFGQPATFPIDDFMASVRQRAIDRMDFATKHGSGLEFLRIVSVVYTAVPITRTMLIHAIPEAGGCIVKLPKALLTKHCVLNVGNRDNMCFRYAIMAWALDGNGTETEYNTQRPQSYYTNAPKGGPIRKDFVPDFIDVGLDFSMLVYPVVTNELENFENTNEIGVYVFKWKETADGNGYALQIRRPSCVFDREVQLLIYSGHYLWIKNFNYFINLQSYGHRSNSRTCHRCLYSLKDESGLSKHLKSGNCLKDDGECIAEPRLPKATRKGKPPKLYFDHYGDLFDHPLVVFADFETYQSKTNGVTKGEHTKVLAAMTGVASYGYHSVSSIVSIPSAGSIKRGSADEFIEEMLRLGLRYNHFCLNPEPMIISAAELTQHDSATCCYLCRTSKAKLDQIVLRILSLSANRNLLKISHQCWSRTMTMCPVCFVALLAKAVMLRHRCPNRLLSSSTILKASMGMSLSTPSYA